MNCIYHQAEKPEVKGREVVDELLNLFREKCRRRIKDRNDSFGPEEFQQGECYSVHFVYVLQVTKDHYSSLYHRLITCPILDLML